MKKNIYRSSVKEVKRLYEYMKSQEIKSVRFLDKSYPAEDEKLEIQYSDGLSWIVFGSEMKDVDRDLPKHPTEKELIFEMSKLLYPSMTSWRLEGENMIGIYTQTHGYVSEVCERIIGTKVNNKWKIAKDIGDIIFKDWDMMHNY